MPIGPDAYPRSVLPESHWEALYRANRDLVNDVLEDIARLARGAVFPELSIAASLPPKYLPRYDEPFLRKFLVCLVSVGLKLRLPGFHPLGCTAEELALLATKRRAATLLAAAGDLPDFEEWDDYAREDADHEWLFAPVMDGIEDSAVARSLGAGYLRYDEWFLPFESPRVAHPYVAQRERSWEVDRDLYPAEDGEDEEIGECGDGDT
jgi:hypothetical protein